jgi:hypothetical protein
MNKEMLKALRGELNVALAQSVILRLKRMISLKLYLQSMHLGEVKKFPAY